MEIIRLLKGQTYLSKESYSLKVQKGRVWVTVEGDLEDYILKKGEELAPQENCVVLVQGLEQAVILFDTETAI